MSSSTGDLMPELSGPLHDFLEDYSNNTYSDYETLAKKVEGICREALEVMEINGLVSSRAKDPETLKTKVPDRAPKWGEIETADDVYAELNDLAGVRIALYFPDDVPKVAAVILKLFKKIIEPIVRTAKRENARYLSSRGGNVLERKKDPLPIEYTNGPWRSVSKTKVIHFWKHSGYRAVHLVVKEREDTELDIVKVAGQGDDAEDGSAHSSEPDSEEDDSELGSDEENADDGSEPDAEGNTSEREIQPKERVMKVEIQITTVVMHAWSEVEHNIIYKNKHGLPDHMTMNRMLDGINGLSITIEILLEELYRTFHDLRKKDAIEFDSEEDLGVWLVGLNISVDGRWDKTCRFLGPLYEILRGPLFRIRRGKELRELITRHNITEPLSGGEDLSARVLDALSRHKVVDSMRLEHGMIVSRDKISLLRRLYKLLVTVNTFNIMILMDAGGALHELVQDSYDLYKINEIIKLFVNPTAINDRLRAELETFADHFLSLEWKNIHRAAMAVASLSFYASELNMSGARDLMLTLQSGEEPHKSSLEATPLPYQVEVDQFIADTQPNWLRRMLPVEFHFLQCLDWRLEMRRHSEPSRSFLPIYVKRRTMPEKESFDHQRLHSGYHVFQLVFCNSDLRQIRLEPVDSSRRDPPSHVNYVDPRTVNHFLLSMIEQIYR